MQHSPPSEANQFSASPEIPRNLCKPKAHYHTHKCPPPVSILYQSIGPDPTNSVRTFRNKVAFTVSSCKHLAQPPTPKPCLLSATAYSIHSQLPSIMQAVPPSATWGQAIPWWQTAPVFIHLQKKCCWLFSIITLKWTCVSNVNLLCAFFWVVPRRMNFTCRRFGTLFSIFIGR